MIDFSKILKQINGRARGKSTGDPLLCVKQVILFADYSTIHFFLKKTQNMVLYSDILVDNPTQYCNFKIFYIYINLYINFKLNKR
jgi:hypothetical protein